jgi:hypothetical protein
MTCPKCLGKKEIVFGSDTVSGLERVVCDCQKESGKNLKRDKLTESRKLENGNTDTP